MKSSRQVFSTVDGPARHWSGTSGPSDYSMRTRYCWDDFVFDLDAYRLDCRGQQRPLEPKAIALLALMVQRPHHLFTKQEIFEAIWQDTAVTDHALTRVVAQLRKALDEDPRQPRYIETVPTRGYRWVAPVRVHDPGEPRPLAAPAEVHSGRDRNASNALIGGRRLVPLIAAPAAAAMLAGLALLAALGGEMLLRRSGSATSHDAMSIGIPERVHWPVQLTTHAGVDMQPDLSPLGDAVAYASDRTGAFEIYVRPFDQTPSDTALTHDGGQNVQPAWSPDGRYVAYHSSRRGGIWVISSRGGIPRQVAATGSKPAWSPDGQRIAFQSDEQLAVTPTAYGAQQGSTIWSIGADGNDLRELTRSGQPAGGHAAPAWSPDGRHIAFTVFDSGSDDGVWVLRLETAETRRGLQRGGVFEVAFAPDGGSLLATSGDASILRLPFDAATGTLREPQTVIPLAGVPGVRGLSVATDGRRLAFAGMALSSQIWAQPISRDGMPTEAARPLTNDTSRRNSVPAVSPDGRRIAYMTKRSGAAPHLWVMDIDGRNAMPLTADVTGDGRPHWFPDSDRVAHLSRRGNTLGLWSVDVSTRREALLMELDPALLAASAPLLRSSRVAAVDLSPSVRRAALSAISPPFGRRIVYVTSIDTPTPQAVTDGGAWTGYPTWSPDERRLAVEIKDRASVHAGVLDIATGRLQRLTDGRGQTWPRSWSPDGRKIAAAALRNGVWDLRWIDVTTGYQHTITPAAGPAVYVRYPDWAPRGGLIVFERGEARSNIWTLSLR